MRHQLANPDAEMARIAARQYGVISVRQLREVGLDKSAVMRRAQAGRLHSIHRGVYAVGHSWVPPEGHWLAATLAIGEGAVLSHRAAASLWRLLPTIAGPIDVSVPSDDGRQQRRGIRLHRCTSLNPSLVSRHLGIPVTKPARTIADLRSIESEATLRAAIRQAELLNFPLGADVSADGTRSELERRFLELCQWNRIPTPKVNVRVGPWLVDFVWPDQHLIVETDGYRYHRGRVAFEDDRARDLALRAKGYSVIRLTHRQVVNKPNEVCAALRRSLSL